MGCLANSAIKGQSSTVSKGENAEQQDAPWSPLRRSCGMALVSAPGEGFLAVLLMFSFVLMILESDAGDDVPSWIPTMNHVLLVFYILEVAVGIFVYRGKFCHSYLRVMDLVIIMADVIAVFLDFLKVDHIPSVASVRIFRMLRIARGMTVIVNCPQLALMVKGLVKALTACLYGVALLMLILTVWSACAVQLIHPVNQRISMTGIHDGCPRCERAFSSVHSSMLTFVQQIIAGDSWGQVTIPIMEEAPETALFFALVFISVHFTIMNVILAVIVDSALKASGEDLQEIVRGKEMAFQESARQLNRICEEMDNDLSGDLTKEELVDGFESQEDFRKILLAMDIKKEDLHVVFSILDADDSGSVNYEEFISELFRMKAHDSHTMLVFIKHYVTEIRRDVRDHVNVLRTDIINKIDADMERLSIPPQRNSVRREDFDVDGPLEVEEKQKDPAIVPRASQRPSEKASCQGVESQCLKGLEEELRSLRRVVSEDLLASIRAISEKPLPFYGALAGEAEHGFAKSQPTSRSCCGSTTSGGNLWPSTPPSASRPGASARHVTDAPPSAWGMRTCCTAERGTSKQLSAHGEKDYASATQDVASFAKLR